MPRPSTVNRVVNIGGIDAPWLGEARSSQTSEVEAKETSEARAADRCRGGTCRRVSAGMSALTVLEGLAGLSGRQALPSPANGRRMAASLSRADNGRDGVASRADHASGVGGRWARSAPGARRSDASKGGTSACHDGETDSNEMWAAAESEEMWVAEAWGGICPPTTRPGGSSATMCCRSSSAAAAAAVSCNSNGASPAAGSGSAARWRSSRPNGAGGALRLRAEAEERAPAAAEQPTAEGAERTVTSTSAPTSKISTAGVDASGPGALQLSPLAACGLSGAAAALLVVVSRACGVGRSPSGRNCGSRSALGLPAQRTSAVMTSAATNSSV
mmetsp:Transcript_67932/g.196729  ORF Transcript_67932/g.196729 Transcript_67932/m.196729 type:complete len:331 (-) Transcript_67932:432-1424(-)